MGLSCGARMLKFLLFIFNLLFCICGLLCVLIGIFIILNRYAVENLATAALKSSSEGKSDALMDLATKPVIIRQIGFAFIIVGLAVLVVAFMGCCGAAKEWRPLLCCYATLLMVILAIELSFAIYAAVHSSSFKKDLRQLLQESLKMYNGTDIPRHRNEYKEDAVNMRTAWDSFMIDKHCCGIDSRRGEFYQSPWYELNGKTNDFPPACCPLRKNGKLMPQCPTISRYGEGCIELLQFEYQFWVAAIYGVFALLAIIEIACVAIAIRLFVLIKTELLYLYD
ncbi:hypothetical protein M3Y97_00221200 [Aphelenchoides bicaudatus]|nr:hypothetical protein M3Y97_00221200 [Aphelenchoides bicaudatus]